MTHDDIRQTVLSSLESIAPDVTTASLDPAADLRDTLDIDSMDFLNFVTALHDTLHVDIPESDYSRLSSVQQCVDYLAQKLESGPRG